MNGANGYPVQSRNPSDLSSSQGPGPGPGPRDARRPGPPSALSVMSDGAMSRAERFEDEKRRMIESCFAKVDANGQLSESYITHIRVQEDAVYPSSPAPPTSSSNNKKARIVVIAVRSSGRVRMHKARENNNQSFSIGKTWNLEDLSAIESYSHSVPGASAQDAQLREWAGSTGFLVTISKPYYWQAGTAKEKDFFIASLVKIFRKYTKGQIPELKGFSDRELEAIIGMLPAPQRPPAPDSRQTGTPQRPLPSDGRPVGTPPRAPFAEQPRAGSSDSRGDPRQRAMSKDRHRPSPDQLDPPRRQMSQDPHQRLPPDGYQPPELKEQQLRQPRRQGSREQGLRQAPSRERLARPSQEQLRAPPSRDMMRPPPSQLGAPPTRPSPGPARLTPKSSTSELRPPTSQSVASSMSGTSRINTSLNQQPPTQSPQHSLPLQSPDRQRSYQSIQSVQSAQSNETTSSHAGIDGAAMFTATVDRWKPQPPRQEDISSQRQRPRQLDEQQQPRPLHLREPPPAEESGRNFSYEVQSPPERKRPLMSSRDYHSSQRSADADSPDLRPPPLSTSRTPSANALPHSPLTAEPQMQPTDRMPGTFYDTPTASSTNLTSSQPAARQETSDSTPAEDKSGMDGPAPLQVKTELPPAAVSLVQSPQDLVTDSESESAHRPGLGPMIKKKTKPADLANTFRKAATAYGAFKPRAGGAGERLAKGSLGNEPDGMNAVVPAPLRKMSVDTDRSEPPTSPGRLPEVPPILTGTTSEAEVNRSLPSPGLQETPIEERVDVHLQDEPTSEAAPAQPELATASEVRRPRRRSVHQENYLRSLDIDPRLLDGRGLEFETILTDFGWGANVLKSRQLEHLEADLKRELGRIEAGSWLGHLEQKDDRVDVVDQMLDRAIAECDELEGLLTLYAVELGSLNDDIAFIEAQSQGLQVQTANQKILHAELHKLVDTISITPQQLQSLRHADLASPHGLSDIESSLLLLYKAMVTIDPRLRSSNALSSTDLSKSTNGLDSTDIGTMHALQEKRQAYLHECAGFCQRLLRHMDVTFQSTLGSAKTALVRSQSGIGASPLKLNGHGFNAARESLWQYSPLLLFAKEVNEPAWQSLLRAYCSRTRPLYAEVFEANVQSWKKSVRQATNEDAELLFTTVERESPEGLTSTARRITVKRSQTLAKTFRATSGDKSATADRQPGRVYASEIFAGVLEEQVPLLSMEQNFFVGLFHATSLENIDFADAVMASAPAARLGQELSTRRLMEPDRNMARRVTDTMEELFGFWPAELKSLMEWAVGISPVQGVGILTTLSIQTAQLQETSQEYVLHNINSISQRLATLFQKFVDEQIRAIEDTKVKINKRKGVIAFMKVFPLFSASVESMYLTAAGRADGTPAAAAARQIIDDAYARINRAMWDSLKVIARESPTATTPNAGKDADSIEKEMLNYHILLIENMHHYIEEVDDGGKEGSVLAEWKGRALMDRAEHMEEYVVRVVRRPLGKVMDFVEKGEGMLSRNMSGPSAGAQPSHTRSTAKKLLAAHDSKEIRRSIEALRKRIEKHFGESDEEQLSRQLVALVCKECERRYEQILDRLTALCRELYKEEEKRVDIEWTKEDIRAGFRS